MQNRDDLSSLPRATNSHAAMVLKHIDAIVGFLHSRDVNPAAFASSVIVAANELRDADCDSRSVVIAAAHAAMIGLPPGRALRLAYFVPRRARRSDSLARCQLEISYQGYCNLALRNKYLASVYCEAVLSGEEFRYGVIDGRPVLSHVVDPDRDVSPEALRTTLRGAYCVWTPRGEDPRFLWMNRGQIDAVERKGSDVWRTHYYQMVLKTPLRRASNYWLLTRELSLASTLETQAELGEEQNLGAQLEIANHTSPEMSNDLGADEVEVE